MTLSNCRALRSCEPRLDAQTYQWRSTFGFFPEHAHSHSAWWQLEDYVKFNEPEYDSKLKFPAPIPIIISVFMRTAKASPTENKTREGKDAPSTKSTASSSRQHRLGEASVAPAAPVEHDQEEVLPPIEDPQYRNPIGQRGT